MLKEQAKETVAALATRFAEQIDTYKHGDYNETQTRRDFIDPFFKALGWDIDNQSGNAEAYREVIHEDKIKVGSATKAPDYSFRLAGGKRLFFVEAKKPSVAVKDDTQPAYQVRRYGWSAKLPISIITDFEEFAVYDCTKRPNPNDKASVARVKYITYQDYIQEFDFLWDTFSKDRVLKGSFDKFVQSDTNKKGTTTVDKEFLLSLDTWRTDLAVNISKQNQNLDEDELNFVVQQTIDRIIFLRIAEDRHIEPYGSLKDTLKQGDYYKNLFYLFTKADEKYNSGLFDLKKDKLSKDLVIENKTLKKIIHELYYPESPYEFSVLSVEILGSAYEQFLGKTIHVETGKRVNPADTNESIEVRRVKIEEKPEVRKAGGVYYTPQYIVDYIVKNTVGKMIEGKTPKEIEKIKIVDPACGSGSFLIGAYQYLLDYHKDYYTKAGIKTGKKESPLTPDGALTSNEKKRILLNNIFGVDIDTNAVEVTKLSLLLKCMEGESETTIAQQYKLWNERILPTLDDNIKSGNSLVDTDYYDTQLDFGEEKKIKPFNWQKAFPDVFKQSGFDIVIGNPPYVRQELLGEQKDYFARAYEVYHGMADLYSYFIEKGIGLIKSGGLFGIIVANKWMRANYGEPLRKWLKKTEIRQIIDFGDLPVFQGATTYPCILICSKNKTIGDIEVTNIKTLDYLSLEVYVTINKSALQQSSLEDTGWNLSSDKEQGLLKKIQKAGIPLGEYVNGKIFRGVLTGLNEAFVIDEETKNRLITEDAKSAEIIKPFLAGRDIKRFQPTSTDKFLIFIPKGFTNEKGKAARSPWKWLEENYSAVATHLKQFEEKAKKRFDQGDYWWELRACDYYGEFAKPKIMLPDIALRMQAAFDEANTYCVNTAYIIPVGDKYLTAVLNSNLVQYYYARLSSSIRGGYLRFIRQYLETIPVIVIDDNDTLKIEIIRNVEALLQINKDKQSSKLQTQIEQLQSRIEYHEDKINAAVYQLYGLTGEEIKIVEDAVRK